MIDRKTLESLGWKLPEMPELDDAGYEKWRPALTLFYFLRDGAAASVPARPAFDSVDRKNVTILREVMRHAPSE